MYRSYIAVARPLDMLDPAETQFEVSRVSLNANYPFLPHAKAADEWCRDVKFLKLASKLVVRPYIPLP